MKKLLAVVLLLALVGCGSQAGPKPPLGEGFNDTDVMFSQMIVNHQATAATLLEIVAKRAANSDVKILGAAVQVTEADEAKAVRSWLEKWQQPTDVDVLSAAHAAHGGLPSDGKAELDALMAAADGEFDKIFLNIFIGHQHQAVEFARLEIQSGINREAVSLAHRVDQSRRAQIEMMLRLVA